MARSWLCRIGSHRWRKRFNDRGEMYRTCARCDVDDDVCARISCALHQSPGNG